MNDSTMAVARGGLREATIEATVLGPCKHCGIGAEFWSAHPDCDHDPTFTRPLGTVSRWHKSSLVRLWWRIEDRFTRRDG